MLFSLEQGLFLGQLGIANAKGERNERYRQTDARNAKQSLRLLVCENDIIAIRSADRIDRRKHQGLGVNLGGESCVSEPVFQLRRKNLVPDGTGNGITKCASDVVRSEVNSGDNSQV